MKRILGSTLAALAAVALLTGGVQASPGGQVSMLLLRSGSDLSEVGWSATGAITDAGDWSTQDRIIGGSEHSQAFVVTQVLTTQVGTAGTFHLRFQGRTNAVLPFVGNWQLDDGSGAYAGWVGTGHWYAITNETTGNLEFHLTGYVHG
jgi:hypothetical protein